MVLVVLTWKRNTLPTGLLHEGHFPLIVKWSFNLDRILSVHQLVGEENLLELSLQISDLSEYIDDNNSSHNHLIIYCALSRYSGLWGMYSFL